MSMTCPKTAGLLSTAVTRRISTGVGCRMGARGANGGFLALGSRRSAACLRRCCYGVGLGHASKRRASLSAGRGATLTWRHRVTPHPSLATRNTPQWGALRPIERHSLEHTEPNVAAVSSPAVAEYLYTCRRSVRNLVVRRLRGSVRRDTVVEDDMILCDRAHCCHRVLLLMFGQMQSPDVVGGQQQLLCSEAEATALSGQQRD